MLRGRPGGAKSSYSVSFGSPRFMAEIFHLGTGRHRPRGLLVVEGKDHVEKRQMLAKIESGSGGGEKGGGRHEILSMP